MTTRNQIADLIKSIEAENDRTRVAEKRTIYAECVGSFEPMLRAQIYWAIAETEESKRATRDQLEGALAAMNLAINKLRLVAPPDVVEPAGAVRLNLMTFENDDPWIARHERLEQAALKAMRGDLGIKGDTPL
jgi:hypothetical protein